MSRPCAILTVGIPGCGKTSHVQGPMFAEFVNVNRDDVRKERLGNVNDHGAEDEITQICKAKMVQARRDNKNLVVSDTNINARHREELLRYLHGMGFSPIQAHVFNVSGKTCLERNRTRDKPVPPEVIGRMEEQMMCGLPQIGNPMQGLFDDVIIIHQAGAIPLMPQAPGASTNTTVSLADWNAASRAQDQPNNSDRRPGNDGRDGGSRGTQSQNWREERGGGSQGFSGYRGGAGTGGQGGSRLPY